MENLACTEGIHRSIDELDKLISEAESLLEDYAVPSSAYDSGISDRDIAENTGNDDIRQSIDQLDAILRQYDSGTIDVDADPCNAKVNRAKLDHQRHSLDGYVDERSSGDRSRADNGAERFEAGDRHSIADPGGLDWPASNNKNTNNNNNADVSATSPLENVILARSLTSQKAVTTASRVHHVEGITRDASSDEGRQVAMTTTAMAQVALARRFPGEYDKNGQYLGANGVYRADSMRSLPPPPEELLYDEVPPRAPAESIYDYPNYPPQGVPGQQHEHLPPPPADQGTNKQQQSDRKRPPALPKRSPSTRLSTASSVSDSPSSPNSQLGSPRFSRCSSSEENRHSQDASHTGHPGHGHTGHAGHLGNTGQEPHHPSLAQHDQRSPGHYQRSYSVPSAHDAGPQHQGHTPLHGQTSLPPAAAPVYAEPPGPEAADVSQKSKFFEQKMDEESVVMRLKKTSLVDTGERPPSFTPPPPPSNVRWQQQASQGTPPPPNVIAKRSPVHQRLNQAPRRMSEQIPPAVSPEVARRSSETCLPPRASSFRGMPTQPIVSPTSPPAVASKPVARSNSTGTDVRTSPSRDQPHQHNVRPSMFRNAVAPPSINDQKHETRASNGPTQLAETETRQASPGPAAPKNSDVIENEGLLKPSKIKSIISGHAKAKPKIQHQQSAPAAPQSHSAGQHHPPHASHGSHAPHSTHAPHANHAQQQQAPHSPHAHGHHAQHSQQHAQHAQHQQQHAQHQQQHAQHAQHQQQHAQHAQHQQQHAQHTPAGGQPSSFLPRQKSMPVAVPSVPKVPVIPIRTGRTPPQQEPATSPPRKNSADLIGEVSTFKLKKKEKKEKLPVGAGKNGPPDTIQSAIVSNLKVGVKLKRRSEGPVIPEIHGEEPGMCDIDDLPPPPPDFADDYYADHYHHQQHHHHPHQQEPVHISSQQESPTSQHRGMAMAVHEQTPPPAANGRKDSDEDIDWARIPGYQPIPDNCPHWKIGMMEKRNKEAYEKYMRELEERAMEDAKWQDVPSWKRNLMLKKELRKKEEQAPTEEERKRSEEEMARLESMPDWKRQIILKKRLDMM